MIKNRNSQTVLKAGLGYTIGNILIKGVGILTLPLFSRIMTTAEFGVYNVFVSYESLLFVVIGLALHSSIRSANSEYPGKINQYVSSLTLIYFFNLAFFLIGALIFRESLTQYLGLDNTLLIALVLYSFCSALLTLYNDWLSLNYAYKQYLLIALLNTVGNVLISILLMFTFFQNNKLLGRVLGSLFSLVIVTLFLLITIYRTAKPKFNPEYYKFGLKYSLPIIPHGIAQVLLAQLDCIMIRKIISDSAAGIYSLAGNIQSIITVITASISTVWTTWFYQEMDRDNRVSIRKKAVQVCLVFSALTIGLISISPEIVMVLGGEKYSMARYVAVPLVVSGFVLFLYNIVSAGEYYKKKTIYIMCGTMIAAALNIVLNYVFIKKFGFIAAAYTTLFSYFCYLLLHIIISRKCVSFYIVSPKWLICMGMMMILAGGISLYFMESLVIRWVIGIVIVAVIMTYLVRDYGVDRIVRFLKEKRHKQ